MATCRHMPPMAPSTTSFHSPSSSSSISSSGRHCPRTSTTTSVTLFKCWTWPHWPFALTWCSRGSSYPRPASTLCKSLINLSHTCFIVELSCILAYSMRTSSRWGGSFWVTIMPLSLGCFKGSALWWVQGKCAHMLFDVYFVTMCFERMAILNTWISFWRAKLHLVWPFFQWTNSRVGMLAWPLLVLTFCIVDLQRNGFNPGPIVHAVLINIYLAKVKLSYLSKKGMEYNVKLFQFFYWETGYFNTIDIIMDRAGYYLCWGCLCWVQVNKEPLGLDFWLGRVDFWQISCENSFYS